MGLGQADSGSNKNTFADDVLKIEICGPDQYVSSESMFPLLDQILSLQTCLGGLCPQKMFQGLIHAVKNAILTTRS